MNPESLAKAFGLELGERLAQDELEQVWRARDAQGKDVALHVLSEEAPEVVRDRFAVAASRASALEAPGVLRVHEVSAGGEAFVSDLWTTGTAKDLPALNWSLRRRLEFLRRVGEGLDAMHKAGLVHGAVAAERILIDDDLHPVLAGMGLAPGDAPEPDVGTDIASLGRLIEEIAGADATPEVRDIVRQCTVKIADLRYASAADVVFAIKTAVDRLPVGDSRVSRGSVPPPSAARGAEGAKSARGSTAESPAPPVVGPMAKEAGPDLARLRVPAGAVGALILVGALAAGYFGVAWAVAYGAALVGGVLATLLVPRVKVAPKRARVGLALLVVAILVLVDPVGRLSRLGAVGRLQGGARAAVMDMLRSNNRDLHGASLQGADLSELDLTGMDLRGADLTRADLSRAKLFGAQLGGASLDGAKLTGADLSRSTLSDARGVQSASCDAQTRLPAGWRCMAGLLAQGATKP